MKILNRNKALVGLFLIAFFMLSGLSPIMAEEPETKNPILSGYVKDASNGEQLLGATIYIREISNGTVTNQYGYYSLSLKPGLYNLRISYLGYQTKEQTIKLDKDRSLSFELEPKTSDLEEVEITGRRKDENVTRNQMSVTRLDVKTINSIPAIFGEVDIIKAIQLLPGVQPTSEGGSGFSVRGSNPDQNLIQLDEALVYNASHLMGFFSVFNSDAVNEVKLYKGDIPASSGGRLASLLDIRMRDGNMKKFSGKGGIGLISSRLTLEGPIVEDKASFLVSARRTYADLFLKLSSDDNINQNILYFYDFNAKLNYIIDDNNRLYFSAYSGDDVFKNDSFKLGWGNQTYALRWNHLFSKKLFSNFMITHSIYDYNLGIPEEATFNFNWSAQLKDYNVKGDFTYYANPDLTLKFGVSSIYHDFSPGRMTGLGESDFEVLPNFSIESGGYISAEQKIGGLITMKYGLRYSLFQNIGEGTIFNYDEDFNKIDSTVYKQGDIYNTYGGFEPRVGITYLIDETQSIKASYSKTRQYIQLASNSTGGTPLDVWFPASPNVKPQIADQVAVGYFRNFKDNTYEVSTELYYKYIQNSVDFKDHAELLLNDLYEGELRFGIAKAYGAEFMVKLNGEKLSGWISYTLSRSIREFEHINNGNAYLSPYDRTQDFAIVLNYRLNNQFAFGMNWIYNTGTPVTFPTGRAIIGNTIVPIYSDRNSYRLPDYHRMDFSITYKPKHKEGRIWHGEWNASVYNAYMRKNVWAINFFEDAENPGQQYAEMTYLFKIIPSITYNFKF